MFFVTTCGGCGEKIIFREHTTEKLNVSLMRNHFCPKDKLNYIVEVHRGFKLTKPPNPKTEPAEPDPFDPEQKGDGTDPG